MNEQPVTTAVNDIAATLDWIEALGADLSDRIAGGEDTSEVKANLVIAYSALAEEIKGDPTGAAQACERQAQMYQDELDGAEEDDDDADDL